MGSIPVRVTKKNEIHDVYLVLFLSVTRTGIVSAWRFAHLPLLLAAFLLAFFLQADLPLDEEGHGGTQQDDRA